MSERGRETIYAALLATLRPIASMLLRLGIGYQELDRVVKLAFVSVAMNEYVAKGRAPNVSRVSLMTGLTRKSVRSIQSELAKEASPVLLGRSLPSEVLNVWHTDFRFCGTYGKPMALVWDADVASFCALVRCCSKSVSPVTVKAELLRVGAISQSENGLLIASRRSFIPATMVGRLIQGLQYGVRPLAMTVAHNAATEDLEALRFQRLVWNYCLPPERRGAVYELVTKRLREFSQEMDDLLSEADESESDDERAVVAVGLYLVEDDPKNFSAK